MQDDSRERLPIDVGQPQAEVWKPLEKVKILGGLVRGQQLVSWAFHLAQIAAMEVRSTQLAANLAGTDAC
jgi:hypothetical protein